MKTSYTYTYTALDLLETVIDFTNLTPDEADWDFKKQMYNDPRMIRLMQIQALMYAFVPELVYEKEIGEGIGQFYSGEFILHRHPLKDYGSLLEEMERTIAQSKFGGGRKRQIREGDLQENFCNLLDYYRKLKKLLNHNSGMMEISYAYYFPTIVTTAMSDSMRSKAGILSRLLAVFIDPREQRFTREEMIEKYFYPEDDLLDVDVDWM